jgi:hypothetical protein
MEGDLRPSLLIFDCLKEEDWTLGKEILCALENVKVFLRLSAIGRPLAGSTKEENQRTVTGVTTDKQGPQLIEQRYFKVGRRKLLCYLEHS